MFKGPSVNRAGASFKPTSHSKVALSKPTSASLDDEAVTSRFRDEAQSGTSSSLRNLSIRCMLTYAEITAPISGSRVVHAVNNTHHVT